MFAWCLTLQTQGLPNLNPMNMHAGALLAHTLLTLSQAAGSRGRRAPDRIVHPSYPTQTHSESLAHRVKLPKVLKILDVCCVAQVLHRVRNVSAASPAYFTLCGTHTNLGFSHHVHVHKDSLLILTTNVSKGRVQPAATWALGNSGTSSTGLRWCLQYTSKEVINTAMQKQ